MRIAPFTELKISERAPDANIQKQHKEAVESLRRAWASSFSIAHLNDFRYPNGSAEEHLEKVGNALQKAAAINNVYDFGVVSNDSIKLWEHRAEDRPISNIPWVGPAVFLMTHPEMTFEKSLSIYLLIQSGHDSIILTELLYSQESRSVLIYQTLVAKLPFGSSREVHMTAYTKEANPETVNSTLNPSIMGAAFVAETGTKSLS